MRALAHRLTPRQTADIARLVKALISLIGVGGEGDGAVGVVGGGEEAVEEVGEGEAEGGGVDAGVAADVAEGEEVLVDD